MFFFEKKVYTTSMNQKNVFLSWEYPEYEKRHLSPDWYWGLGIFLVVILGVLIYFQNFILAFIVFLMSGIGILLIFREPKNVQVEFGELGITYHHELIPYEKILAFSIPKKNADEIPHIYLHIDRPFLPVVHFPLPDSEIAQELEALLSEFAPEYEIVLPLAERIMNRIGF
jgi:hypothetical protein